MQPKAAAQRGTADGSQLASRQGSTGRHAGRLLAAAGRPQAAPRPRLPPAALCTPYQVSSLLGRLPGLDLAPGQLVGVEPGALGLQGLRRGSQVRRLPNEVVKGHRQGESGATLAWHTQARSGARCGSAVTRLKAAFAPRAVLRSTHCQVSPAWDTFVSPGAPWWQTAGPGGPPPRGDSWPRQHRSAA